MTLRQPLQPLLVQRGAVLIVSLILLVLLTMFAIAAMNYTNVQSRIAGNLQVKTELRAAAQQAMEQVVSTNFTTSPLATDVLFDMNGDGVNDYTVNVTHTCISSLTIKVDDLGTTTEDRACTLSLPLQNPGVAGFTPSNASLCANALYDVAATATDASTATFKTSASVVAHQGIAIRVAVGAGC